MNVNGGKTTIGQFPEFKFDSKYVSRETETTTKRYKEFILFYWVNANGRKGSAKKETTVCL